MQSYKAYTGPAPMKTGNTEVKRESTTNPPSHNKNILSWGPRSDISFIPSDNVVGEYFCGFPHHDNDHVDIRDIKILPTTDEILCSDEPYMPLYSKHADGFITPGVLRYLDKHFRHLRYDNIASIIDAFHDALLFSVMNPKVVDHHRETKKGTRYNFFAGAQFENIGFAEKRGAVFQLSYSCPPQFRQGKMYKSSIFQEGMLCGLVAVHDKTKEVNTVLFEVFYRLSTEAMKSKTGDHSRAAVRVMLADPSDSDKVAECAYYARGLYPDVKLYLVDMPTILVVSFRAHLERLQQLFETEDFAFKDKLAPSEPSKPIFPEPPKTSDGFVFNLGCLKKDPEDKEDLLLVPRQIDSQIPFTKQLPSDDDKHIVAELSSRTTLDEGQVDALFQSLNRDFALVQGPPGTGKSFLGVKLAQVILKSREVNDKSPIIVVCMTNHAVDDFLEGLIQNGNNKVTRIGTRSACTWIKPFTLQSQRSKVRRSRRSEHQFGVAKGQERAIYTKGVELGEALSANSESIQWAVLSDYLSSDAPEVFKHFLRIEKMNPGISDLRRVRRSGFAFQYWIEGGDLKDFHGLEGKFAEMLGSCELDDVLPETLERIKKYAVESIAQNVETISSSGEGKWLWDMNLAERHSLATSWYKSISPWKICMIFADYHTEYRDAVDQQKRVYTDTDCAAIEQLESDIVALTSTGFAQNWDLISELKPKTIIFEEASELSEAHSVVCLVPSITHCIKIGDPKQLRPQVEQMVLSKDHCDKYRHDESLFERFMETEKIPFAKLNTQRRAHPEMANLLRVGDYPFLLDHPSTLRRPVVAGVTKRMYWLDHSNTEDFRDPRAPLSKSYSNSHEATFISEFVRYLVLTQGYKFGEITILTPYKGQLALLTNLLSDSCKVSLSKSDRDALVDAKLMSDEDIRDGEKVELAISSMLRITTVDNYQGEQARVIIFSAVRSNERNMAGFLKSQNRINVAVSRAEDGFYVIGNSRLVSMVPYWKKIVDHFKYKALIGPYLEICCPKHTQKKQSVQKAQDFSRVSACKFECNETLPCGHSCKEVCHPIEMHYDGRMVCQESCSRLLPCGHKCDRLCCEPCGPCNQKLSPRFFDCWHVVTPICGADLTDWTCMEPIGVEKLECGHDKTILCYERLAERVCTDLCGHILWCGHRCIAKCGTCSGANFHPICASNCGKELRCGHTCQAVCHPMQDCPPCKQTCRKSCEHQKCNHRCGEPCNPCVQLVEPQSCVYHQGEAKPTICCLPNNIIPCSEPCTKLLSCGVHLCPGICGERCKPAPCAECDGMPTEELATMTLECNHVFPVKQIDESVGLRNIFKMSDSGRILQVKISALVPSHDFNCPSCSAPTSGVRRFQLGNSVETIALTVDHIYAKLGRFLTDKMERMRVGERVLGNKLHDVLNEIKNGPLAGKYNQEKILQHGVYVKDVQGQVIRFRDEVVVPVEESIVRVTRSMNNETLFPVPVLSFKLRMDLIIFRGRLAMVDFAAKVIEYLNSMTEADKHTIGLRNGLIKQTVEDCAKAIDVVSSRISECKTKVLPRLETEYCIIQVALWTILRALKAEHTSILDPEATIQRCMVLIDEWPETAKLMWSAFRTVRNAYNHSEVPRGLQALYRAGRDEKGELWDLWKAHKPGATKLCPRGHPYSEELYEGCPECGRWRPKTAVGRRR